MHYLASLMLMFPLTCKKCSSENLVIDTPSTPPSYRVTVAFPNLSFTRPVDLQHAGDGTNRLFVVEQAGRIRVFTNDSAVPSSIEFLNITARVNDSGNEEGLLGLAFHPLFSVNGYFYVNYTATNPRRTVISRFQVTADSNIADPNSEFILLEYDQPYSNHNGGQVAFGPDGYLYIASGDGGSGGDPQNNGQNLNTLLGKLLRIDVNNPSGGKNYGIPADNPFQGAGQRPEIFAYGLRNPWRFSFDAEGGTIWCADVGQNQIEEIDIVEKGKNYGWRIMEGNSCYNTSTCNQTGLTLPVWQYDHSLGISVTGGYVYRGTRTPSLTGWYLYGDFGTGRIWALRQTTTTENRELLRSNLMIASFGQDANREVYICSFDGKIYRIEEYTP